MGRRRVRHQPDLIEVGHAEELAGGGEVAIVDRVEGPAQDADVSAADRRETPHRKSAPSPHRGHHDARGRRSIPNDPAFAGNAPVLRDWSYRSSPAAARA